jgi:hypothetical protein
MHPTDTTPHTHDELREILARLEGVEGPEVAELRRNAERLLSMPESDVQALVEAASAATEMVGRTGKRPGGKPRRCACGCGQSIDHLSRQARYVDRSHQERAARRRIDRLPLDLDFLLRRAHEAGRLADAKKLVREWEPPTSRPTSRPTSPPTPAPRLFEK